MKIVPDLADNRPHNKPSTDSRKECSLVLEHNLPGRSFPIFNL